VPHLEREAKIYADEVQGVRAFGSEDANLVVQTLVDDRLADLRAMHEVTLEYHRAGAVQGKILDADGSTIYNLFNEFGLAQQTQDIALSSAGTDVRGAAWRFSASSKTSSAPSRSAATARCAATRSSTR
jgi:hypothetical protein